MSANKKTTTQIIFGQNISYLRKLKDETQEKAAAQLHISRKTLSHLEKGRVSPNLELLVRIGDYYNYRNVYKLATYDLRPCLSEVI